MKTDIVRWQTELQREDLQAIEQLMLTLRCRTKKEFFETAVTLLQWAAREVESGRVILARGGGREMELALPALLRLTPSGPLAEAIETIRHPVPGVALVAHGWRDPEDRSRPQAVPKRSRKQRI